MLKQQHLRNFNTKVQVSDLFTPVTHATQNQITQQEAHMPIPLITYETIASVYGADFAQTWFQPYSLAGRR